MSDTIGVPYKRLDGRLKVTGKAKYSGDWKEPGLLHAVIFNSTIASGKIKSFDLRAAKAVPGVVDIITFENAPKLGKQKKQMGGGPGESFWPLQDNSIYYNGQHIGCVIAKTLEAAQDASHRVKVVYETATAKLDFEKHMHSENKPSKEFMGEAIWKTRGEGAKALAKSDVQIESVYRIPTENHNPMEPGATFTHFDGDKVMIYDATQGVSNSAEEMANIMKLKPEKVTVITKFVGGGFGCKGSSWPHQVIAALATMKLKKPIKLVLTREQMFTGMGSRAQTSQTIGLGAKKSGELTTITHTTYNHVATYKDFTEPCESATPMLYQCPNIEMKHYLVPLNYIVPTFMRAPGHSTGSFSLESAMDELADKLKIDPIDLRMKNYAKTDQDKERPFTSKTLDECYKQGAEKFGWSKRPATPGTRRDGDWMIGYGMATATYPAQKFNAKASVVLQPDGRAIVRSATQDIGTGTYTIMTQIAAQYLGLKMEQVDFDLGNSKYPPSGVSGGSTTASSTGSAVKLACDDVLQKLRTIAVGDKTSPLYGARAESLMPKDGALTLPDGKSAKFTDLIARNGGKPLEGEGSIGMFDIVKDKKFADSGHAFGAQFVEVRVHARTGEVRVNKMCGAFACGKILNPLTARSQFEGGMIFGIGMALLEVVIPDTRNGRLTIKDLADYHMPVQMDVPEIDVLMVNEVDTKINPIGTKGIGEIGITGLAAAVANAVYNATGIRIRELPITPDKILRAMEKVRA